MSLRLDFVDDFSRSAFQLIDGEQRIVGKWGQITQLDDGTYDCWFVGLNLTPLTAHRLAAIRQKVAQEGGFRQLTGEASIQGRGRAFVLKMAAVAGIKRKRRNTPGRQLGRPFAVSV